MTNIPRTLWDLPPEMAAPWFQGTESPPDDPWIGRRVTFNREGTRETGLVVTYRPFDDRYLVDASTADGVRVRFLHPGEFYELADPPPRPSFWRRLLEAIR